MHKETYGLKIVATFCRFLKVIQKHANNVVQLYPREQFFEKNCCSQKIVQKAKATLIYHTALCAPYANQGWPVNDVG